MNTETNESGNVSQAMGTKHSRSKGLNEQKPLKYAAFCFSWKDPLRIRGTGTGVGVTGDAISSRIDTRNLPRRS